MACRRFQPQNPTNAIPSPSIANSPGSGAISADPASPGSIPVQALRAGLHSNSSSSRPSLLIPTAAGQTLNAPVSPGAAPRVHVYIAFWIVGVMAIHRSSSVSDDGQTPPTQSVG